MGYYRRKFGLIGKGEIGQQKPQVNTILVELLVSIKLFVMMDMQENLRMKFWQLNVLNGQFNVSKCVLAENLLCFHNKKWKMNELCVYDKSELSC